MLKRTAREREEYQQHSRIFTIKQTVHRAFTVRAATHSQYEITCLTEQLGEVLLEMVQKQQALIDVLASQRKEVKVQGNSFPRFYGNMGDLVELYFDQVIHYFEALNIDWQDENQSNRTIVMPTAIFWGNAAACLEDYISQFRIATMHVTDMRELVKTTYFVRGLVSPTKEEVQYRRCTTVSEALSIALEHDRLHFRAEKERVARDKAIAVEDEVQRVYKEAEEMIQQAVAKGSELVEKTEASVKRAQDKLMVAKGKSASLLKDAELESWGKTKEVEAKKTKLCWRVLRLPQTRTTMSEPIWMRNVDSKNSAAKN
ncbi:hypothetical protein ON010_g26 [Phytophthora cinnamomi]|nr:hypothetical protein ON010_g26 [Phytophthora cinnamomi]